jgi:hypothetical protein
VRTLGAMSDEARILLSILGRGPVSYSEFTAELINGIKKTPSLFSVNKNPSAAANILRQMCTRPPNPKVLRLKSEKPGEKCSFILNPDHKIVQEALEESRLDKERVNDWRKIIAARQPEPEDIPESAISPGPAQLIVAPSGQLRVLTIPAPPVRIKHIDFFCDLRDLLLAMRHHSAIGWWEREVFPVQLLAKLAVVLSPNKDTQQLLDTYKSERVIRFAERRKPARGDIWGVYEVSNPDRYQNRYPLFRQPNLDAGQRLLARMFGITASLEDILQWKAEVNKRCEPSRLGDVQSDIPEAELFEQEEAPPVAPEPTTAEEVEEEDEVTEEAPALRLENMSEDELAVLLVRVKRELARKQLPRLKQRAAEAKDAFDAAELAHLEADIAREEAEGDLKETDRELLELQNQLEALQNEPNKP